MRLGRYETAYRLTQLAELSRARDGAALTLEHFAAFHRARPLRSYEVVRVSRLEIREPGARGGTPFFEVTVRLEHPGGTATEELTVAGAVAGRVQPEPDRLFLELEGRDREVVSVDGVRTPVRRRLVAGSFEAYPLLLLRGAHDLRIDGLAPIRLATGPLRVLEGPARADGSRLIIAS